MWIEVTGFVTVSFVILLSFFFMKNKEVCNCQTMLDGKVVVITGATSGIGKETALHLAKRGASLVLASRDFYKGKIVAKEIKEHAGDVRIEVLELDVSNFKSLLRFSKLLHEMHNRVDILINNAGVFYLPEDAISEDGLNLTMTTNYVGPMYLTFLLLDLLKAVETPSRIINVSSHNYKHVHEVKFCDFFALNIPEFQNYAKSKLALNLGSLFLSELLSETNVTVNIMTPGFVYTNIIRHFAPSDSIRGKLLRPLICLFFREAKEGAQTINHLALCKDLEKVSGKYFSRCKEERLETHSCDPNAMISLWVDTRKIFRKKEIQFYPVDY